MDGNLADMVKLNIQDVMQRFRDETGEGLGSPESGPSTSAGTVPAAQKSGRLLSSGAKASSVHSPSSSGGSARPLSARGATGSVHKAARPSAAAAAPGGDSTSVLDVPGHAEATIRLHKARIKALEQELADAAGALSKRDKAEVEAEKELKALRAEKAAWLKTQKTLEAQIEKYRKDAASAASAATAHESRAKEVSKDVGRVEKERKAAEAEAKARDVRLARALEEVERYKAALEAARAQERDVKDVAKGDYARLLADVKRLERQKGELLAAFRKQGRLVDVLRRQRIHLEAARALAFTEEEFVKALDVGGPA